MAKKERYRVQTGCLHAVSRIFPLYQSFIQVDGQDLRIPDLLVMEHLTVHFHLCQVCMIRRISSAAVRLETRRSMDWR